MNSILKIFFEELDYRARCFHYSLDGGRLHARQKILVNGSPKTGTTWMIKLLTSIPGYQAVGNFNGEIHKYAAIHSGDVVHGHDEYSTELNRLLLQNQVWVVLMLRDPRDQAVSRVFHLKRDTSNTFHAKIQQMDMDEALMACIEGRAGLRSVLHMLSLNQSWFDSQHEIYCVRYEDMIVDPQAQLQQVLRFLGIPASQALVRSVIVRNRFERLTVGKKIWRRGRPVGQEDPGSHFRKGIAGDWKNYFNEEHKKRFKEIAGPVLIEMGYEQNLDW